MSDQSDDDDPIVESCDVVLTGPAEHNLRVLCAPLRPAGMPYGSGEHETLSKIQYKPKADLLELGVRINLGPQNRNSTSPLYDARAPDLVVQSTTMPPKTNYVLGTMHDGALHITPVSHFMLMRPDLSLHDAAVKAKGEAADKTAKAPSKRIAIDRDDDDDDDEAEGVHVTYARRESEVAKQRRESSYSFVQSQIAKEPFVALELGVTSPELRARVLLGEQSADAEGRYAASPDFAVTPTQYIAMLTPATPAKESAARASTLSMESLMTLTVEARALALLKSAHILEYQEVENYFSAEERSALRRALPSVAWLVRGHCVVRSFPEVVEPALAPARDFAILLLSQSRTIDVLKLKQHSGQRMQELREILKPLVSSVNTARQGLEFKLPDADTGSFADLAAVMADDLAASEDRIRERLSQSRAAVKGR